jgi:aconitate hydratase
VRKGLAPKPWVKTSLAPGSQVVAEYLEKSGLQKDLDALGFYLVGFGCTTCIGNSGPLPKGISKSINDNGVIGAAILSGNRNFEGRVSPDVQANYLASPPLVVAYALAGSLQVDLVNEPLGTDQDGAPVYLKDIWPSNAEIQQFIRENVTRRLFETKYADVFEGDANWRSVEVTTALTYRWNMSSSYVQNPPYFEGITMKPAPTGDIVGARILGLFGDKITTDHISPAGSIKASSPAGEFLRGMQVRPEDFNQYGTRRGNHEVMVRGTFANIRIKNFAVKGEGGVTPEGGWAVHQPSGDRMSIFDAATRYQRDNVPLVVFAGVEYGNGSSRDWAAKGTKLLGVRAVIAQSFERIHRSNLVGMGILPFVFDEGTSWKSLGLTGSEQISIKGIADITPGQRVTIDISMADGTVKQVPLTCRIDTLDELNYYKHGGILPYVLRQLAA